MTRDSRSPFVLFQSDAQELETVKMARHGGGLNTPKKEEQLRAAAQIHIKIGQIQRYCELVIELGQVRLYPYTQATVRHWSAPFTSLPVTGVRRHGDCWGNCKQECFVEASGICV